jgi:flagellar motor switch/type III secretory pathway protein FliN
MTTDQANLAGKTIAHSPATMRVELGRQWLGAREVSVLGPGSVVELQSDMDSQVDVYVGGQLAGSGDLVVVEGKLGVRMLKLGSTSRDNWSNR